MPCAYPTSIKGTHKGHPYKKSHRVTIYYSLNPMLSTLLIIPLLGAALAAWYPGKTRSIASTISILVIAWTVLLVTQFNLSDPGMQFVENFTWVEALGLSYRLGLDGLSLPLIALNSLLTWIAIYSSDNKIDRPRLYYSLILLLNAAVSGVFLAQDLLLFFIAYELELIPLYLLIAIWGGQRRAYAATKFLIYTALSGALILAAFLGLAWFGGSDSFIYNPTLAHALPLSQQFLVLGALLLGFGIKMPLFPFHTWLPDAHVEASTPISVLLAGVILKMATYGILRFCVGLFPVAWQILTPWLSYWAVASVLYGALMAIAQTDMKKMVAYSSVSHMGYILLAAAANTPLSYAAAMIQMVSHGLISAALFLCVGVVYQKAKTRDINVLQGLLNPERGMPVIGSLMVVGVMASAGIPGMVGFIAEFLIFRSSFTVFPVQTLLCMLGTGLTAVYYLLLINKAFFGRLSAPVIDLESVTWRDRYPAMILTAAIVLFGWQPNWITRWSEPAIFATLQPQTTIAHVPDRIALLPTNRSPEI
jgi:NAD(P)H-quinone oxidoreductase subunit 4